MRAFRIYFLGFDRSPLKPYSSLIYWIERCALAPFVLTWNQLGIRILLPNSLSNLTTAVACWSSKSTADVSADCDI